MPVRICKTCGAHFAANAPPDICTICANDRQYVKAEGQHWLDQSELQANHHLRVETEGPDIIGLGITPDFAISQRALLVRTPHGNILWDCTPFISPKAIETLHELGGIDAIAISHPHFYSSMVQWSEAFNNAPIFLNAKDKEWVMTPSPNIQFWDGPTKEIFPGFTLIECGGHFPGSTILHSATADNGGGAIFTGDTAIITQDRHFSFMYSFPNTIPLNAKAIRHIQSRLDGVQFNKAYSGWWGAIIEQDARQRMDASFKRYLAAIA